MSATQTATRTVGGIELPVPGTYHLDASHTYVGFSVRHLAVSKLRGRFTSLDGVVTVADDPLASSVEATIDLASVDTRDEQRDEHLRSVDFFDVERHPSMDYRSTGLTPAGDGRYVLEGELTIGGVSRPVSLDLAYEGALVDPWGNQRFGFSARGEINREDFGLTWNQMLETGGVLVGKKVTIEIEGEAVRIN